MTKKNYFITGIGTEVGKTIASAVVVQALEADYWKPIQAGDLDHSDTDKVKRLVKNDTTVFYPNAFALKTPMSPHAAAAIDNVDITAEEILKNSPTTNNHLVTEGAGGLYVPINDKETITSVISDTHEVIVVSRHYLGSINHTLLTIKMLQSEGKKIKGILFMGNEHPTTEDIIKKMSQVPILGRIDEEPYFDSQVITEYAERFSKILLE